MIKNEEEALLVKEKFKLSEAYLNDLESIFSTDVPLTPETLNVAKVSFIIGKLSIQIQDLEAFLEVYGSVEDMYKDA